MKSVSKKNITIGLIMVFIFSVFTLYHILHISYIVDARYFAKSEDERVKHYVSYLAEDYGGMFGIEAEDYVLQYYSSCSNGQILSDFQEKDNDNIRNVVKAIDCKLRKIHRR